MPRWINIIGAPFDYYWPDRSAVTHFSENGDFMVKDEVADFAVKRGLALEGKKDGASRSLKGKTAPRKRATTRRAAKPRTVPPVGDKSTVGADRSADRAALDADAG